MNLHLVSDDSGGVLIIWEDYRNGYYSDVYAQHVMSNGQVDPDWPLNGLPVISYIGRQEEITVDTDGSGGAIVAWKDTRFSGNMNIYAQRVTPQGTLLWNSTGQAICTFTADQIDPKLCPDGQGGAFIVWLDKRLDPNFGDIYFQHIDSSGNPQLTTDGVILCNAVREQKECRIISSGDGGAIFCWVDFRYDEQNSISDIFAQKVSSSGDILWGNNGLAVCTADEIQIGSRMVSDGSGGVIIAWEDTRNVNTIDEADLYAQRVSSAGSPMWTTNGVLVSDADEYQNSVLLKSNNNHGAFLFWGNKYGYSNMFGEDLFTQHLDSDGIPQLQPNGVLIHHGMYGNAEEPMMVQTIPGQVLVAWKDYRYDYNASLYIQLIDTSGNYLLEQDGRPLCVESLNGNMDTPQLATDFQNGGLLVWMEQRNPNLYNQIYVQRIDPSGNSLWTAGGVHVFSIDNGQQNPYVAGDGTGGAFVVWSGITANVNLHVYAQRLNASGSQVWNQPVELSHSVDFDDECYGEVPDGESGVIIVWMAGPWPDFYVLAQKLDPMGNEVWQSGGVRVSNTNGGQWQPTVIADGNGGAVFVWRDYRDLVYYNLFAQKIDHYGNLVWADSGLSVCNVPSDKGEAELELDCDGNVFVVWQDFRSGVDQDIFLQKITPFGGVVFQTDGLPICVLGNDQLDPEMVSDTQDGVYITWENYVDSVHSNILCQHINGNGELASGEWQINGSIASNDLFWRFDPTIGPDGFGGCIIAWEDGRASGYEQVYNLFAQRMNDGTVVSGVGSSITYIPSEFRLKQNYPNPFNPTTRIDYSLPQAGLVNLIIYDILGRKVRTLQNQFMTVGTHHIFWNGDASSGDPVASGTYFYKLQVPGHSQVRKMVLLK